MLKLLSYINIIIFGIILSFNTFGSPQTSFLNNKFKVKTKEVKIPWKKPGLNTGIICQDGGTPVKINNDECLLVFGDTFYKKENHKGAVSNSVCKIKKVNNKLKCNYKTKKNGTPAPAITLGKGKKWKNHRIWPNGGIKLKNESYLFFEKIVKTGKKIWDFKSDAYGLAKINNDWDFEKVISPQKNYKPLPILPQSIVKKEDTLLLFYLEKEGKLKSNLYLAKVSKDNLDSPTSYKYWNQKSKSFVNNIHKSSLILKDVWGQVSVNWNNFLNKYIIVHGGGFKRNKRAIYLRTSNTPHGPWSEAKEIFKLDGKIGKNLKGSVYCIYLQPFLTENDKNIYISFCIMRTELTESFPQLIKANFTKRNTK